MFSAACLLISSALLFFILRYRVHVHVTYTPINSRSSTPRKARLAAGARMGNRPIPESQIGGEARLPVVPRQGQRANLGGGSPLVSDIVAALRGQGCTANQARSAAQYAVTNGPQGFESVLRRAIQYAHQGAAA